MPERPIPVHRSAAAGKAALWPWWLGWVVFIVYGSLVPLDFHPLPPEVAWQALIHAPLLDIDVGGRADWIANGVLYFPLGFLTAALLLGRRPDAAGPARRLAAVALSLAFGAALAVAVEFAQTAFPPRTVSRNDLISEGLGTAIGVVAALAGAGRVRDLLAGFGPGGQVLAWRLGLFYAVIYPALALFPFDLLLSAEEWRDKLNGGSVGWWLAGDSQGMGAVLLLAKLGVEAIAVAPLGALWSHWRAARPGGRPSALPAQLLRGALIGLAQLTIASGQSQGVSVLTRAIGFALGASAWQARGGLHPQTLRVWLRCGSWPLLGANVVLLGVLSGAWRAPWLPAQAALQRLQSEVVSLVAVSLSYAPLGLLGWDWGRRGAASR